MSRLRSDVALLVTYDGFIILPSIQTVNASPLGQMVWAQTAQFDLDVDLHYIPLSIWCEALRPRTRWTSADNILRNLVIQILTSNFKSALGSKKSYTSLPRAICQCRELRAIWGFMMCWATGKFQWSRSSLDAVNICDPHTAHGRIFCGSPLRKSCRNAACGCLKPKLLPNKQDKCPFLVIKVELHPLGANCRTRSPRSCHSLDRTHQASQG